MTFDLVVVGGGIHGVGVLQAAAAAGHTALLLEERAIAAGTSSRSSKLIHGGLRYLESGQVALVRESLAERAVLARIAPGLVRLVPFHVPVYRETRRRPWQLRAGLSLYAVLGGLARDAFFRRVPRARWAELDGLRTDGLEAVFRYFDGQTDDAELARAVLRSARSLGAESAVPARFERAERTERGWRVRFDAGGSAREVEAGVVVNAGGPWIDRIRSRITPRPPGLEVDLVAGTHIELPGRVDAGIYYVESPSDARAVFVMPWKDRTLVGTTETPYRGDPAEVAPLPEEILYLRATLAHYFPARSREVLSAWAGLRVLPRGSGAAFDRPRETTLVVDDERHPTTLAIYGGKLTGYRATAQKVIARLRGSLPDREPIADTAELRLE